MKRKISMFHYRTDIDGLRALAVMLVMAYHCEVPFLEGGFLGVDIFFVISGYVITQLLMREENITLAQFYLRRIRRLMPSFLVVLLATLALASVLMSPYYLAQLLPHAMASLLFSANLYIWSDQVQYFHAQTAYLPLLHTWSLAVEEQFYLVYPLVLFGLGRVMPARAVTLVLAVAAGLSAYFCVQAYLQQHMADGFYLPHLRMWELLLGALVARGALDTIMRWRWCAQILAVLGVAAMLYALDGTQSKTLLHYGVWMVVAGGGCAMLLAAGRMHQTLMARALSVSLLVSLGRMSYVLYLWHWPLLSLAKYYQPEGLSAIHTALLMQLAFVLAYVTHRYVEMPWRSRRDGIYADAAMFRHWASVWAAQIGLLGVLYAMLVATTPALSVAQKIAATRVASMPLIERCNIEHTEGKLPPESACVGGKTGVLNSYQVVLWGDSHAKHYAHAVMALAEDSGVGVRHISKFGCMPLFLPKDIYSSDDCRKFVGEVSAFLASADNVKLVVMAGAWADSMHSDVITASQFEQSLQKTVAWLRAQGKTVLILDQVPPAARKADFEACILKLLRSHRVENFNCISPQEAYATIKLTHEAAMRVVALHPSSVVMFSPFSAFCKNNCKFFDAAGVYYQDASHLSVHGSLQMKPLMREGWERALRDAQLKE